MDAFLHIDTRIGEIVLVPHQRNPAVPKHTASNSTSICDTQIFCTNHDIEYIPRGSAGQEKKRSTPSEQCPCMLSQTAQRNTSSEGLQPGSCDERNHHCVAEKSSRPHTNRDISTQTRQSASSSPHKICESQRAHNGTYGNQVYGFHTAGWECSSASACSHGSRTRH